MSSPRRPKDFDYQRYLASREWAVLKEAVRERCQNTCEICFRGPHQDTHHLTYTRIGAEDLDDLIGVCRPCHEWLSGKTGVPPLNDFQVVVSPRLTVRLTAKDLERFHKKDRRWGHIALFGDAPEVHLHIPYGYIEDYPDGHRGTRLSRCYGQSCPFCALADPFFPMFLLGLRLFENRPTSEGQSS